MGTICKNTGISQRQAQWSVPVPQLVGGRLEIAQPTKWLAGNSLTGEIYIDPNDKDLWIETEHGPMKAFVLWILVHELGHVCSGDLDDGEDDMENTKNNEVPVMKELGYPGRTKYIPVNPRSPKYRLPFEIGGGRTIDV